MRTSILISAVVLALILISPAFAFDTEDLNLITFSNLTKNDIEFIFLSPGDSEYWGPEILGAERILEPGKSQGFYILYPEECNNFDIMAIDSTGGTFVMWDYPICDDENELVEIVRKDLTEDTPEMSLVTIYIENETYPMHYVFISPADSQMWGVDYLDEETIMESDSYVSFLFPADSEPTEYDLMAVDEDMDVYKFSFDIDLDSDESAYPIELSDLQ